MWQNYANASPFTEQKGDQEPCSTTRGPDAVTQEHQQSKRAPQDRRECAVSRTRAHSPTETYCDCKRETVRSCVLCCCRAVYFHASAKDCKGKVYFKDSPTNGYDRSQIPLNARSVWADSAFIPMLQRRIVANIKSCIVGTAGTDCCIAVCYLASNHESRFGNPWFGEPAIVLRQNALIGFLNYSHVFQHNIPSHLAPKLIFIQLWSDLDGLLRPVFIICGLFWLPLSL